MATLLRRAASRRVAAASSRLFSTSTPKPIALYDTTLRDGTQGEGVSLSLHDKLLISERLDDMGFDYIEGGYPLSNEKDVAFFEQVKHLGLKHATPCAFGMTRRKGIEAYNDPGMVALLKSEAPVCTIVGKTWDFHVEHVLRVSLEENLSMIHDSVGYLASSGRRVFYDAEHFFDGYKANPEHAIATIKAAADAGAEAIALCDTNGGSMPHEVEELVKIAAEAVGPEVDIAVHCHNDCSLAVANSLAAVTAGATQVQGTINGIGERCGNADLIAVAGNLALKSNGAYRVLGDDLATSASAISRLTEFSRYVDDIANLTPNIGQPFVGRSAFAHKGGMHAHAMALAPTSYEHIDPSIVGNTRRVLVSELSGRSNIAALTEQYGITDPDITKNVLAEIVRRENLGYQYEAAEASFALVVHKAMRTFTPHFKRIRYEVSVAGYGGGRGQYDKSAVDASFMEYEHSEATVKLALPTGRLIHEVAEGNGPVAALDAALRKALEPIYPNLNSLHLTDYKVRVVKLPEDASKTALHTMITGTASAIRVIIDSRDRDMAEDFSTCGVGTNIIEASWRALVDAIEYKLARDDLRWAKECYSNEEAKMGQAVVEADEAVVEELAAGGSSTQQSFDLPEASKSQPRA